MLRLSEAVSEAVIVARYRDIVLSFYPSSSRRSILSKVVSEEGLIGIAKNWKRTRRLLKSRTIY